MYFWHGAPQVWGGVPSPCHRGSGSLPQKHTYFLGVMVFRSWQPGHRHVESPLWEERGEKECETRERKFAKRVFSEGSSRRLRNKRRSVDGK